MRPYLAIAKSTSCEGASGARKSRGRMQAAPPAVVISRSTEASLCSSRAHSTHDAPWLASAMAIARPMPRFASRNDCGFMLKGWHQLRIICTKSVREVQVWY
jgi:hypothetical protein